MVKKGKIAIQKNGESIYELAARIAKGRKNTLTPHQMREMAIEERFQKIEMARKKKTIL